MKKRFGMLILFMMFFLPINVLAEEYQKMSLIPVDTVATVNTEKFSYQDFVYNSQVDANGNSIVSFGSISNNTISKSYVSINLLLFDGNKENIGFLTYCTAKDISSDFAGFKLEGNQSSAFSILVTSKYFAKGMSAKDVSYMAVMDENKYCQVGGYDNYKGLTIEQISEKNSGVNVKSKNFLNRFIHKLTSNFVISNIIIVISIFILFFALGALLNELHMKMYGYKDIVAYLPVTDTYIAAKIVFGQIAALIYFALYVISLLLIIVKVFFLAYIMNFILLILVCLTIIKLATKNYTLFYLESPMKLLGHNSMANDDGGMGLFHFGRKKENIDDAERDTSLLSTDQPMLDLSYDNIDNSISSGKTNSIHVADGSDSNVDGSLSSPSISDLYQPSLEQPSDSHSADLMADTKASLESQGNLSLGDVSEEDDEKNDFDDFF